MRSELKKRSKQRGTRAKAPTPVALQPVTTSAVVREDGPATESREKIAAELEEMFSRHEAATVFLRRTQPDRDTGDEAEANVQKAVRLMRLFNEQIGVMAKLKGTASQQKVTVEHVHVHQGGQAIVGAVGSTMGQPGALGRGDGS